MGDVILALDVGDARIGLARGELGSSFAFGRGVIERGQWEQDVAAVASLARREGAALILVGLPTRRNGTDSPQTTKVRAFGDALKAAGLNIAYEDERFSTVVAERSILDSGLPKMKRRDKGRLDEAAAVEILETYLARFSQRLQGGT